jgi:phage repressor protein C with HTH and peptisase S24 domain
LIETKRCRRKISLSEYRRIMAAKKAARAKKYNAANAKNMEKFKGTTAYNLMKKYGGEDSHLTWAELKAGLQKEGKSAAQVEAAQERWINATQ